jgi:hypothetical protein
VLVVMRTSICPTNVAVHLPSELIKAIIGYRPDRSSIGLCSLISRPWVPWTRAKLFSEVRLGLENLLQFLILLQSPYCTFPCYVRRVYIQAYLASLPNSCHKPLPTVLNSPQSWLDADDNTSNTWGFLYKARTSMVNVMDGSRPIHFINLFCLFPAIEHLHLQLQNFRHGFEICNGWCAISHTLKISLPNPRSSKGFRPEHWKNVLKWVVRQKVCNISRLYLDVMAPWSLEGAQEFEGVLLGIFMLEPYCLGSVRGFFVANILELQLTSHR